MQINVVFILVVEVDDGECGFVMVIWNFYG